MATWSEGDRVRVVERAVTDDDRKKQNYYAHMAGLTGLVQNVYGEDEVSVRIEPVTLGAITADVHRTATTRMREKLLGSLSEEQKKGLTPEELQFDANFVLLVKAADLEKA
ncbi:MAG: hypothetical protein ACOYON_09120 [Fimbriimonas sp.]